MLQNRINTRLPEQLALHVAYMCEEKGLYETSSEFVRDLIRQHYEKTETEKLQNFKAKLVSGANAGIEEFVEINLSEQLEKFKLRYKAEG